MGTTSLAAAVPHAHETVCMRGLHPFREGFRMMLLPAFHLPMPWRSTPSRTRDLVRASDGAGKVGAANFFMS